MKFGMPRFMLSFYSLSVLAFLFLPILVVIPMSFSSASSLQFPPPGFSLRWYAEFFSNPEWIKATQTSFLVAFFASLSAIILGGLAAYGLSRWQFRGRNVLLAQFIAPMIIPTIISAVAMYMVFAKVGLLGSIIGLVLGHIVVTVPFVVLILFPVFENFDIRLELAARSLGASKVTTFFRIFLPNVLPSVLGAWFFAFMISFDELVVSLFLSGRNLTLPKKIYNELILQINPVITAISTLLIGFTAIVLLIIAWLMNQGESQSKGLEGLFRT